MDEDPRDLSEGHLVNYRRFRLLVAFAILATTIIAADPRRVADAAPAPGFVDETVIPG